MFHITTQREWDEFVRKGLNGESWKLEVAAETVFVVEDPERLSSEGRNFLSHLVWLSLHCEEIVSWLSSPSCARLREEFSRFHVQAKRVKLPVDDRILLKRMFNAVPVLWAEDLL